MKKKILSFILAVALALNLGCGNVMAYVSVGDAGDVIGASSGTNEKIGFTVKNEDIQKVADQNLGDLVTMFGYAAGSMTYSVSKASINYYDANGFKAGYSISYKEDSTVSGYTLNSIRLTSTDIENITKNGTGSTDTEKVQNFLIKACGSDALKTVVTRDGTLKTDTPQTDENGSIVKDDDGNIVYENATSTDEAATQYAAWLTDGTISNWLKQGNNFSVQISLGGNEPQATLIENGKSIETVGTYNGKTYVVSQNTYENGFLKETVSASLVSTTNEDGSITYTPEYTVTEMDEYGQQKRSYKGLTDSDGKLVKDASGNIKSASYKKTTYDTSKNEYVETTDTGSGDTVTFNYSANGSLASYTDNTSGNTYHYSAGKTSYVTNDAGAVVTKYNYENDILKTVQAYNGSTVTATTVFDEGGRNLATFKGDYSSDTKYKTALNEYYTTIKNGTVSSDTTMQSFNQYKDNYNANMIANYNSTNIAKTYGYTSAISSTEIITGDAAAEGKGGTSEVTENNTADLAGTYYIKNGKFVDANTAGATKVTAENKNGVLVFDSEASAEAWFKAATGRAADTSEVKTISELRSASSTGNSALEGVGDSKAIIRVGDSDTTADATVSKILTTLGKIDSGTDVSGTVKSSGGVYSYALGANYTTTTTKTVSAATACLKTTAYIQGIAICQTSKYLGQTTSSSTSAAYNIIDPAVVGKVTNVVEVDGKNYAVVDAAKVDILDGNGFQAANGETIYVEITEDMAASLKSELASKGSVDFAAAGYIAEDVDGYLTIANVYDSAIGKDATTKFVNQIVYNEVYQENLQSNMEIFKGYAAENGSEFTGADWKAGWYLLSGRTDKISFNSESGRISAAF